MRRSRKMNGHNWIGSWSSIARRLLVARRFLDIFGPLGAGLQDVDYNVFGPLGEANISLLGEEDAQPIQPLSRVHEHLPMLYKDFVLYWRDLETSRRLNTPLDTGAGRGRRLLRGAKGG